MKKFSFSIFLITFAFTTLNVKSNNESYLISCSDSLPNQECPESFFYSTNRSASERLKMGWNKIAESSRINGLYSQLGLTKPALCWEISNPRCYEKAHQSITSTNSGQMHTELITKNNEHFHFVMPDGVMEYYPSNNGSLSTTKVTVTLVIISAFIASGAIASIVSGDLLYLLLWLGVPVSYAGAYLLEHLTEKKYKTF